MKKALRIIIPILLTAALICCAAWYLLVYDREFTRDILLTQARHFEEIGNHKAATWMYDLAYFQSQQDDNVAIELAQQYVKSGNYTKAEYTLSQAISKRSSAQLYAALCATYVQQDKLLDAVNLLDSIADPKIKQALDASRPTAPTINHTPGFYSQYISLTLESGDNDIYVSIDGHYPSMETDLYTQPITLPGGESVLYAVAVNERNLVSSLQVFGYTVGGVIEEVTFTDPVIEQTVRQLLNTGENTTLFTEDLWSITSFTLPSEATSCDDLRHMIHLRNLTIENFKGDLSVLSKLNALEELNLRHCKVTDDVLKSLSSLTGLKTLVMESCGLSTIASLSTLTGLTTLDLSGNTLRNIDVISTMTKLQRLDLAQNALVDVSALSSLMELNTLDVSGNSLTSLTPIFTDRPIMVLVAGNNQISQLNGIETLKSLGILDLNQNLLTDISPLAKTTNLVELNISNNSVIDISCLYNMINLTKLNFAHNLVKELPKFVPESPLVTIDGSHNQLKSLENLSGLQQLNNVLMDYNKDLSSLQPLDNCPLLVQVNAYGTKVKNVSFLTEKSVIVNFDPSK